MFDKRYMNTNEYELCPHCGKKLFRVTENSVYENIFVWCKNCKKEIKVNKRVTEPKC